MGAFISPENTFAKKEGSISTMVMESTIDHMIIRELLLHTIKAAKLLNTDKPFREKLAQAVSSLAPTRIGSMAASFSGRKNLTN